MSYNDYFAQERSRMLGLPRITWAVQRIILFTAAVFVAQLAIGPLQYPLFHEFAFSHEFPGGMLNVWFGFQPHLVLQGLVWKPFTYMFLHGGLSHLCFNMLSLYFFGPEVERSLGTMQFMRFYLFCGVLGVLATFIPWFMGAQSPSVVGASGAVMGALVAFAVIDPNRTFHLLFIPWPISARGLVILAIILNIISALPAQGGGNTSVATHFGGMLAGFAYMKLYPQLGKWKTTWPGKRPAPRKPEPASKVGEAVDNIFKFKDPDRR